MSALHFFRTSRLAKAIAGSLLAVVSASSQAAISDDEIRIGYLDDMSGPYSDLAGPGGLEAIRMVEEGVASAEDIDNAMTLGYKHPIGPLALTDIVGLDVRLGVAEYLTDKLGPRFEPPQLMRDMVERGELGRKSGKGFYTYDD